MKHMGRTNEDYYPEIAARLKMKPFNSLTKLSGKTPVLPSSVPFHQPGSSSCLATWRSAVASSVRVGAPMVRLFGHVLGDLLSWLW